MTYTFDDRFDHWAHGDDNALSDISITDVYIHSSTQASLSHFCEFGRMAVAILSEDYELIWIRITENGSGSRIQDQNLFFIAALATG